MKLMQIVCDKTNLHLTKEKKQIKHGEVFEVSDERAKEILDATFKGKPVAKKVIEKKKRAASKTKSNNKEVLSDN